MLSAALAWMLPAALADDLADYGFDARRWEQVARAEDPVSVRGLPKAETTARTMAVGVVARLDAGLGTALALLDGPALFLADDSVLRATEVQRREDLEAVGFDDDERPAVRRLVRPKASAAVNLSEDEARAYAPLVPAAGSDAAAAWAGWDRRFREALWRRVESYRADRTAGIPPTRRASGPSDLGADLAAIAAEGPLRGSASDGGASRSRIFVLERVIGGDPVYSLIELTARRDGDRAWLTAVEFYVTSGYDASDLEIALWADGPDRTRLAAVSRALTDRIKGPIGALARPIGRGRLQKTHREQFGRLVQQLTE